MSFRSSTDPIRGLAGKLLLLAALLIMVPARSGAQVPSMLHKVDHVILITVDGMHAGMVTDPGMPSPFMKKMAREGIFIPKVGGIPPTSTYPSHTTIVTGKVPAEHGIYYNTRFACNRDTVIYNWWADSIKTPTIWQRAAEKGLVTASLFWPVSTGCRHIDYNVPEFWSVEDLDNQLEYLKGFCTPEGILDELEMNATGKLDHVNFYAGNLCRDAREAYMVNYLMDRYSPSLLTLHLIATDYAQHATGKSSQRTMEAVASADNAVGLILEHLRLTGMDSSTVVIVCGDHGFSEYGKVFCPNVWLVREGLLSESPGGEWDACFHKGGATQFLYLRDRDDRRTLRRVRAVLESLPDSTRALFRVVEADELRMMGADPEAVLALDPVEGVTSSGARTGSDVYERRGGDHGYLSGIDPAACIVYGSGIPGGVTVEQIRQTDIAPLVLRLLGVEQ